MCTKIVALSLANDKCTTSADCVDGIPCVGGLCQGLSIGKACVNTGSCVYGAYCAHGVCAPNVPNGGNCSSNTGSSCAFASTCGYQKLCVPIYSVPLGGNCDSTMSSECLSGLYCDITSKCSPIPAPLTCQTNADCTPSQQGSCQCSLDGVKRCSVGGPATGFPLACSRYIQPLVGCMSQFQCQGPTLTPNGCAALHCSNQYNCYLNCAESQIFKIGVPPSCNGYTIPCSPATFISSTVWLAMIAVLLHFL